MVRLIGFGLILVLPLKLCKLNMTNNNCINEHKGSKVFFFLQNSSKCTAHCAEYRLVVINSSTLFFFSLCSLYHTIFFLFVPDRHHSFFHVLLFIKHEHNFIM